MVPFCYSLNEDKWEDRHSMKYMPYSGNPVEIITDMSFTFLGIKFEKGPDLYLDKIIELTKGYDGIEFLWKNDRHKVMKCIRHRDCLEISMWGDGKHFGEINIDTNLLHPLHVKYGSDRLKLTKLVYSDMDKSSRLSLQDQIDFKGDKIIDRYFIESLEFDILDKNGNAIDKLVMSTDDVFYNVLISKDKYYGSKQFYKNSGLKYMLSETYDECGMPYLRIGENYLERSINNKNSELYGLELEKSTEHIESIQKWRNKMAVLGYNIECTDSALSLIEESYNKLHTDTTLTIPGFSYIKQNAFMDVPVSKIRITSDRTYTIPELPYGSSSASFYHDRNSKPVEIEYNFKKENKYFNTLLSKLYVNSKINEFWISDNFSGCMYLITIQIPM